MTIVNTVRDEKFNRFNTRLFQAAELLKFDELLASVKDVLKVFEQFGPSRLDERAARVAMRSHSVPRSEGVRPPMGQADQQPQPASAGPRKAEPDQGR